MAVRHGVAGVPAAVAFGRSAVHVDARERLRHTCISAEIAKEQATATLGLMAAGMEGVTASAQIANLFESFSACPKLAALSFMLFNLFISPCVGAVVVLALLAVWRSLKKGTSCFCGCSRSECSCSCCGCGRDCEKGCGRA
jgi:hypothetical protein